MLVHIVVATLPDNSAMDTSRMGTVEDLDPEIARAMLNAGTGRLPTDEELAAYRGDNPEQVDDSKPVDGPRPVADEPYTPIPAAEWQAQQADTQQAEAAPAEKAARPRKGEQTADSTSGDSQ